MTFNDNILPTFQNLHINNNTILDNEYDVPEYISETIEAGKIYISNTNEDMNNTSTYGYPKQAYHETFKCFISIPRQSNEDPNDKSHLETNVSMRLASPHFK